MTVRLAALNETIYQEEKKFLIEQYVLRLLSLLETGEEELDESTIEALLVARSQASPDLAERISSLLNIDSSGETALATQESTESESASMDPTDADLQDDEEDEDEVEGLFDGSDQGDEDEVEGLFDKGDQEDSTHTEDEAEGLFDKGEEDSTHTEDEAEGLFDENKETSINTASEDTEASPIDQTKPKARKKLKKAGKKKRLQGEQNEDAGVLFGNDIYSGNEGGHQQEEAGQFQPKEGHQQEETGQFEAKEGHQQEEAGKFQSKEGHQQEETGQFEAKERQLQKERKKEKGEKKVVKADEILAGSKAGQAPETAIEATKSKIGQRPETSAETPAKDNKSYNAHTDELAKRKEDAERQKQERAEELKQKNRSVMSS
jgi:hypothetical protein